MYEHKATHAVPELVQKTNSSIVMVTNTLATQLH